jgi:hypothetical protein
VWIRGGLDAACSGSSPSRQRAIQFGGPSARPRPAPASTPAPSPPAIKKTPTTRWISHTAHLNDSRPTRKVAPLRLRSRQSHNPNKKSPRANRSALSPHPARRGPGRLRSPGRHQSQRQAPSRSPPQILHRNFRPAQRRQAKSSLRLLRHRHRRHNPVGLAKPGNPSANTKSLQNLKSSPLDTNLASYHPRIVLTHPYLL